MRHRLPAGSCRATPKGQTDTSSIAGQKHISFCVASSESRIPPISMDHHHITWIICFHLYLYCYDLKGISMANLPAILLLQWTVCLMLKPPSEMDRLNLIVQLRLCPHSLRICWYASKHWYQSFAAIRHGRDDDWMGLGLPPTLTPTLYQWCHCGHNKLLWACATLAVGKTQRSLSGHYFLKQRMAKTLWCPTTKHCMSPLGGAVGVVNGYDHGTMMIISISWYITPV